MLKTLIAIALMVPVVAFSATKQQQVTVLCNDDGEFLSRLRDEYKEQPIIVGTAGEGITMSLLTNLEKDTWSLIGVKGDTVCVFMTGNDIKVIPYKKSKISM